MKIIKHIPRPVAYLALFAIASLAACRSDQAVSLNEQVIGSWRLTSYVMDPPYPTGSDTQDLVANRLNSGDKCPNKIKFVFSENHTIYHRYPDDCKEAASSLAYISGMAWTNAGWKVQNDTLVVWTPTEQTAFYKLKFEGNTMVQIKTSRSQVDGVLYSHTTVFERL